MACKHLIVDVGNTLMKCALFDGDVLLKEFVCDAELQPLLDSVSGIDISGGMWSAVCCIVCGHNDKGINNSNTGIATIYTIWTDAE